ncbi:MAG: hypothetical protein KF859_02750 [Phycisphaeraceae bacterium]|nr:hypothetical protein [Phycisphaeraceae bacterium]
MNSVISWLKSNVLIVVCVVVIAVSLPASFVASRMWQSSIVSARQKAADDEYKKIKAAEVTYTLPTYVAGQQPVSLKTPPNAEVTAWFRAHREDLSKAAAETALRAEQFNEGLGADAQAVLRTAHRPLVEGLFPSNPNADAERAKQYEMEEILVAKRGRPNIYQQLLDSVRAGAPADPVAVNESIKDMLTRETEKITAGKRGLTQEEQDALLKQLGERRIAFYQAAARDRGVYATLEVFPRTPAKGKNTIPFGSIPEDAITTPDLFINQWDYWVLSDVFAAVRLANSASGGGGVENAVVKRIETIELFEPEGLYATEDTSAAAMGFGMDTPSEPVAAVPGMVPEDPTASITRRGMGKWNTVYDIRRVRMVAVVSSARLNDFLNAITRTNFMTVTSLNLAEVSVWDDLRDGYYYGTEHVVRATLEIETIWLRSWMLKYMPRAVRGALGVPGEDGDAGSFGGFGAGRDASGDFGGGGGGRGLGTDSTFTSPRKGGGG